MLAWKFKIRLLILALLTGGLLTLLKFYAYYITASNAIFTDALESIANLAAGAMALYSMWVAAKPRDVEHPYGHGKIEFLSSGFEAVLIMAAGLAMVAKAGLGLLHPPQLRALDLGLGITAVAGAVNFGMGWYLHRQGGRHHSLTLQANGKHLMSDGYSSAGLVLGLLAVYLGRAYWLDNVLAIGFGAFIFYTGWRVFRQAISGVMDEADTQLIERVVGILNQHRRPAWIDAHNLRIIKFGPQLHIDCHVTLPWYLSVQEAHEEIKQLELIINREMENRVEVFIHTDPCVPTCCALCAVEPCPHRKQAFQQTVTWTPQNVMTNRKHQV
ncbi:MAG: cation diffusion facilitator family transporter [Bernardetiaceae bacterium]|nr:cation diffusion facilitator family transporter [Bernardetiaceae bacterium]